MTAPLTRLPRRVALALFLLLVGTYGYFYQAGGWNQNSRIDLVRAIVEDGTFRIDRFEANTGDDAVRDGHYYCDKAPAASALCVPVYWLTYRLAGTPQPVPPAGLAWAVWLCVVCAISLPSAAASVVLADLLCATGLSAAAAVGISASWSLGTMALPYSTLLYGNQLAASALIVAFALFARIRMGGPAPVLTRACAGALLGVAVAAEYPAALVAVPLAVYGLSVVGIRRVAPALVGGLVPTALLLGYHWYVFGSPLAFPYDFSVWETPHTGWFMGIGVPRLGALRGTLIGEYRGLLYASPWLLAALPGTVVLWRRHRIETALCAWAVVAFLWLNTSIPPWHGGWATGPRYVVPMLPFLAWLAGGVFLPSASAARPSWRRTLVATFVLLASYSAAQMFVATAVKPEVSTSIARPYTGLLWPRFLAGDLSISTQSIDAIDNPEGAPKQAWNLGMKAGLDGQRSLLPLYAWLLACGVWLVSRLRHGVDPR